MPSLLGHQLPPIPASLLARKKTGVADRWWNGGCRVRAVVEGRMGPMTGEERVQGLLLNHFLISAGCVFLSH